MTATRVSRPRLRAAAVTLGVLLLLAVGAVPAWAHSELQRSEPPNGGKVAVGRSSLSLSFTEPIAPFTGVFDLRTLEGDPVPVHASTSNSDGLGYVTLHTKPLARGTYVLDWKVLSLDDGHPTRGSVVFGAGVRPVVTASGSDELPGLSRLVTRWIDLVALMVAIGSLAVFLRAPHVARFKIAPAIGAVAACTAVAAGALIPLLQTPHDGDTLGTWLHSTWSTLSATRWGHLWLARETALAGAAVALWAWWKRPGATGYRAPLAAVLLGGAVGLEAWAGHASELPRQPELAAVASGVHLAAAGVWAGGLAVAVAGLVPLPRRRTPRRRTELLPVFGALSPMFAVAAVLLLATGLYESGRHIPTLHSVTSTFYGGGVGIKLALVTIALLLAGINTLLVNPGLARAAGRVRGRAEDWTPVPVRRFPRVVAAELTVLAVAAVAAGLILSVPTARDVEAAATRTTPHATNVDGLFVTFEEIRAGDEARRLIVRTRSTVRPDPGPVTGVDVALEDHAGTTSTTVKLKRIEPGRYEAETSALAPGAWDVTVAVHRKARPTAEMPVELTVTATHADAARPLETATTTVALVLLAMLAAGIVLGLRRRRNERRSSPARLVGPSLERR